ncbi:hypothetical protein QJS10_CPA10g00976 [Acorus calamus]|uniref:Uncharacterized protein n=1 Tax=Acorus calamus TaxID=4465 RepID=A0AAV9DZG7_ACOCL|nr:hypothetical protein QJS10_CPA10g00976 [Acorus calamus]
MGAFLPCHQLFIPPHPTSKNLGVGQKTREKERLREKGESRERERWLLVVNGDGGAAVAPVQGEEPAGLARGAAGHRGLQHHRRVLAAAPRQVVCRARAHHAASSDHHPPPPSSSSSSSSSSIGGAADQIPWIVKVGTQIQPL